MRWFCQPGIGSLEILAADGPEAQAVTDKHFTGLEAVTSTKQACELLGASRATRYRRRRPPVLGPPVPRPAPPNALSEVERQHVLSLLRSEEYCDLAPAQIWARLLDDGTYLCSISTMYRSSIQPVVQGMTLNAGRGPASPTARCSCEPSTVGTGSSATKSARRFERRDPRSRIGLPDGPERTNHRFPSVRESRR